MGFGNHMFQRSFGNSTRATALFRQQRRSGPSHMVAGNMRLEQGNVPLCSPTDPDTWVTLDQAPGLDALCCTSCGARGSPHITYQQSNVARWGASFFWVHCHLCLSAFGTLIGNVLRTYASVPKENSITARAAKERRGSVSSGPEPPVTPRGKSNVSALRRLSLMARDHPLSPLPPSRSPFMDFVPSSPVKPPPAAPRFGARAVGGDADVVNCKEGKPGDGSECDDNDWEVPESPVKLKPKHPETRELQLQLQLMNCTVFTLPFQVKNDLLRWSDLPELVTAHLSSPGAVRALEVVLGKGGSWEPFNSTDERRVPAGVDIIYGRVTTGKPFSPPRMTGTKRESSTRDQIIVLASDSDPDEPSPAKRQRSARGHGEVTGNAIVTKKRAGKK